MATVNHKRAVVAEELVGFGGIDAASPYGDGRMAYDMKNFKVLPDGSLVKRDGFAVLASLPEAVRGLYVLHEESGDFILAVAGAALYRISVADGTSESAEVLTSFAGRVGFFGYDGELYLMDGVEIYRYLGGVALEVCSGYVPLYGSGWHPNGGTVTINEPINLLSRKIRIKYSCTGSYTTARFHVKAASVDAVYRNGVLAGTTIYKLAADGTTMTFTSSQSSANLEVYLTLDEEFWRDTVIRSCEYAVKYDSFIHSRVFLWGGDAGAAMYVSQPVSAASMGASLKCEPSSTSLYFPKDRVAAFDAEQTITAVRRVGDRVMVCMADGAWITEELGLLGDVMGDAIQIRPLSQSIGCCTAKGIALAQGDLPVTVTSGGLYRWEIDPELARGCTMERFSDGIAAYLGNGRIDEAVLYYVGNAGELWMALPGDAEGRVFVYDFSAKVWYSYTGIAADEMFDASGCVGFVNGGDICLFDSKRTTDLCTFGEREIVATFVGRRMDFGDGEALKRAVRVYLEADAAGGELTVGLHDDVLLDEVSFAGDGATCHVSRVNTPRFRRLAVSIRAEGVGRQRIFSLCVHARG